jgi:hypothetical protein
VNHCWTNSISLQMLYLKINSVTVFNYWWSRYFLSSSPLSMQYLLLAIKVLRTRITTNNAVTASIWEFLTSYMYMYVHAHSCALSAILSTPQKLSQEHYPLLTLRTRLKNIVNINRNLAPIHVHCEY